jgi:predicted nucleic-acid-binding protein
MIGVDTNVLVRLFISDEPQSAAARKFFGERGPSDPAFVSLLVLSEFGWVLRKKYKKLPEEIRASIQGILDSDDFVVEQRALVETVLSGLGPSKSDLADLFIARTAELAGCRSTVTFDRSASKFSGMALLK